MDETQRLIEAGARERTALRADPLRAASTRDLVAQLAQKSSLLVKKEIELAKAELKEDVRSEIKMASGLGVAGVCGLMTLQLILVAIVFALFEGDVLPGWAASLVVAFVVLVIGSVAGLWGWAKRVRKPLDTTRRSLEENVRFAKERIA